jgi:hypothetical protein
MAVGDVGTAFTTTNDGTSWSAAAGGLVSISGGSHPTLDAVSCFSSTSCVAAGDSGVIETWNGTGWTQQAAGKTGNYLGAISCTTVSGTQTCYVVGGAGTVLWSTSGFGTWSTPTWSGSPATVDLLGVSCQPTGCVATGESGVSFAFSSSASSFTTKNTGTRQPFAAISCPGLCIAVGYPGLIESSVFTDYVFVEATDSTGYFTTFLYDTQKTAWSSLGTRTIQGAPQACWNSYLGRLDVYAVGSDDNIYTGYVTGPTSFSGWTALSSGTSSGPAGQTTVGVVCLNNGTANEEIFVHATGTSNILWGAEYNPSGSGSFTVGWTQIDSAGGAAGKSNPVATVHGSTVYIYVVGTNGEIFQASDSIGTFSNGFTALAPPGGLFTNFDLVGVNARPDGYDDLFYTDTTSAQPHHTAWNGTTELGSNESLGGTLNGSAEGVWNAGEVHAYGVGTSTTNNLFRLIWDSNWGSWGQLTNEGTAGGYSIGVAAAR